MSEICTTRYAVIGNIDDAEHLFAFIMDGNADNIRSEVLRETCKNFFLCLNEWGDRQCVGFDTAVGRKGVVTFSLNTKNSPDHAFVAAAMHAAVGRAMQVFYDSWCVGCGDYRTNDTYRAFFDCGYVWDYEGQEDYLSLKDVLDKAESAFGRRFSSVEEVNDFVFDEVGYPVIIEYSFEKIDFEWE